MSEADVTAVRELLEAFNRGDYQASTAMLHDEAELHQAAEVPDTRTYRGREDFARGVARWISGFEGRPYRCWVYWNEDDARKQAGLDS
jgi:SnoaL-like domain